MCQIHSKQMSQLVAYSGNICVWVVSCNECGAWQLGRCSASTKITYIMYVKDPVDQCQSLLDCGNTKIAQHAQKVSNSDSASSYCWSQTLYWRRWREPSKITKISWTHHGIRYTDKTIAVRLSTKSAVYRIALLLLLPYTYIYIWCCVQLQH